MTAIAIAQSHITHSPFGALPSAQVQNTIFIRGSTASDAFTLQIAFSENFFAENDEILIDNSIIHILYLLSSTFHMMPSFARSYNKIYISVIHKI